MPTAQEYLENILRMTGDKTDFMDASEEAYVRGLQKLNQYIEKLRVRGLTVNASQTEIETYAQPVNFPSYAIDCIEHNVAVMLWPISNPGLPIPMYLKRDAQRLQGDLMFRYGPGTDNVFPSTLPLGSGNRRPGYDTTNLYYPDNDPVMYDGTNYLTNENDGYIEVE